MIDFSQICSLFFVVVYLTKHDLGYELKKNMASNTRRHKKKYAKVVYRFVFFFQWRFSLLLLPSVCNSHFVCTCFSMNVVRLPQLLMFLYVKLYCCIGRRRTWGF